MTEFIEELNGLVWGPAMLALLLGTGIYLTIGLRFMPLRRIPDGIKLLLRGRSSDAAGDIPPFSALMTSLSATIGTGNIAGVATAIALGGPGALFWMWMTALFGWRPSMRKRSALCSSESGMIEVIIVGVRCIISATACIAVGDLWA